MAPPGRAALRSTSITAVTAVVVPPVAAEGSPSAGAPPPAPVSPPSEPPAPPGCCPATWAVPAAAPCAAPLVRERGAARPAAAGRPACAPEAGAPAAGACSTAGAASPSRKVTGVNVSLAPLRTPCAPHVRKPQVTLVQSMLLPPAPVKVGPGTVRFTRNDPSDPIVAWASPDVDEPGKATKAWKPWLLRDCSSGT